MNNLLNGVLVRAKCTKDALLQRAKSAIREERGGAEIIAVIILVAIVVLLAVLFRTQIGTLVKNIWTSISGKEKIVTSDFPIG
jgi:flagellin-like protein